jgi:hypothetical protein
MAKIRVYQVAGAHRAERMTVTDWFFGHISAAELD